MSKAKHRIQVVSRRATRRLATLLALVSLVAACDDRTRPFPLAPAEPTRQLAGVEGKPDRPVIRLGTPGSPSRYRNFDQELLAHGRAIPGFGGYWIDQNGVLNVNLINTGDRVLAQAVLARFLSEERITRGRGRALGPTQIRVHQARYTVEQLAEWRNRIWTEIGNISGATGLDLDEQANRVGLAMESAALFNDARAALARLGIPIEAVALEARGPGQPRSSLRDEHYYLDGGMRLVRYRPDRGGYYPCSLGVNMRLPNNSNEYFLTASHCTDKMAVLDGRTFFHPESAGAGGTEIGTEAYDPPWFTQEHDSFCGITPERCRNADAAIIQHHFPSRSGFGYIARTSTIAPDSAGHELDPDKPWFRITNRLAYSRQGDFLEKIGQTTGWTYGMVSHTCYDKLWVTDREPDGYWITCMGEVDGMGLGDGDSGAPVFYWNTTDDSAEIVGIITGDAGEATNRRTYFSQMGEIDHEIAQHLGLGYPSYY